MAKKHKISQYRDRLNETLSSSDLENDSILKTLIRNQLERSSLCETEGYINNVLEKRTAELSNTLEMLRSASLNDKAASKIHGTQQNEWKLKQDTEEFRVMYREGPHGSPFHTLLTEGYTDAPLDVCLCVSLESAFYKKWWPQFRIPTFKIISCKCLQKVQIGEHISSVRVKLSWPLSDREAVVHYFVFEYLQDDLIIVLLNTISDLESIDRNDGISEEKDMVKIDLVGGIALQKVNPERSYFRVIVNMDIKLDFVPPSLINFISRQLVGSGFRLYQKAIASVLKGDEDYSKALEDPLYSRIREALYSNNAPKGKDDAPVDFKNDDSYIFEKHLIKTTQADVKDADQKVLANSHDDEFLPKPATVIDQKVVSEIEEEEIDESRHLDQNIMKVYHSSVDETEEKCQVNHNQKVLISPAVKQALETLEKVMSFVQNVGFNGQTRVPSQFTPEELPNVATEPVKGSSSPQDSGCSDGGICIEVSNNEIVGKTSNGPMNSSGFSEPRRMGSNSYAREVNHNRIAPASPEQHLHIPSDTHQIALCSSEPEKTGAATPLDKATEKNKEVSIEANGIHDSSLNEGNNLKQQKRLRFCCLHFQS